MAWGTRFVVLVAAVMAACGLTVSGAGSSSSSGGVAAADAAADQEAGTGTIKVPIVSFACGAATCTAGAEACCATTATFSCQPLDAGCKPDDSGPPSGPPLNCTTSNGCPGEHTTCCYDATGGSACTNDHCSNGQVELCRVGLDGCGEDSTCEALASPPAPSVGSCHNSD